MEVVAAISVGTEIIQLRYFASTVGLGSDLDATLKALARGNSEIATTRLAQLDDHLASLPANWPETSVALRARGSILAISEALIQHASYFDAGARG
jgi:hypothetical protein